MALTAFLKYHALPEALWGQLADKVEKGSLGCNSLEVMPGKGPNYIIAKRDLAPDSEVFLVDHVVAATRSELPRVLANLPAASRADCATALSLPGNTSSSQLEAAFWRRCKPAVAAGDSQTAETVWHLDAWPLSALLHTAHPNMTVVALPDSIASEVGGGLACRHGVSMAWVTSHVAKGEPVVRNWLPGKQTLQWAVRLITLLPERQWWRHPEEHESLRQAVQQALQQTAAPLPGYSPPPPNRPHHDPRLATPAPPSAACDPPSQVVFTDYPLVADQLAGHASGGWSVTQDRTAAGILYLVQPQRDFLALGDAVVNQFPYEGCLVRKDLLPQTLRQYQYQCQQAAREIEAEPSPHQHPWWFPEAFDLTTEAHAFAARQQELGEGRAAWCVKLAGGSRTSDPCVASTSVEVLKYMEAPGGDRVAQRYIGRPLLLAERRKFDLRCYVVVRSMTPLDAYLHGGFYARLANKAYAGEKSDLWDLESHFSVMRYHDDPDKANKQETMTREQLEADLREQGYDWDCLLGRLRLALRELLTAASLTIGAWPHSRGVYGVDMMLAEEETGVSYPAPAASGGRGGVPQLLEVNFSGDLGNACKTSPTFVQDVFGALFGKQGATVADTLLKL